MKSAPPYYYNTQCWNNPILFTFVVEIILIKACIIMIKTLIINWRLNIF